VAPRDRLISFRRRDRGREASTDDGSAKTGALPFHVAIIMDGNGRWAKCRHLPVAAGHRAGARAVRRVLETARDVGIAQVTLYSFSTENWSRSPDEVAELMRLHAEMIDSEVPDLHQNGCRVVFVGRRDRLGIDLLAKMAWAEDLTCDDARMTLFIAFDYGGRREIVDAVHSALIDGITPEELDETVLGAHLYSPVMRDVDLVIRTSGERRLSNFLLWQTAYAELYFTDKLWPDFGRDDLLEALAEYGRRERRFGSRDANGSARDSGGV
jgi:undecaprenyl diphosphate synthase